MIEKQTQLKNYIDLNVIQLIAYKIVDAYKMFPAPKFIKDATQNLETLELKQRVIHIITVLNKYLPGDYKQTATILTHIKDNWKTTNKSYEVKNKQKLVPATIGFAAWPFIDYVSHYGLEHPKLSLKLIKHLTPLFSAEFAIRPFIINHYDITYKELQKWCNDKDEQVRRLVSEGSRPRLPWGQQLPQFCKDPKPVLALLENLKDDPSETVRRSVANNLNDITKDNPEIVINTCINWLQGKNGKSVSKERKWIINHATRTLVKAGHPQVFALLGFTQSPKISVSELKVNKKQVRIGDKITFSVNVKSEAPKSTQNVVVDYALHFMKNNGQSNPKVFKLKTLKIKPDEAIKISKSHSFQKISTRKYYPGTHSVELLINGISYGKTDFKLTE